MPQTADVIAPLRRLGPAQAHTFFGYYDIPAADALGRHLYHRVEFRDRFPTAQDTAALGWVPLAEDSCGASAADEPFGQTTAWNFQQGSMLQWVASQPGTCLYNVFEEGRFSCCLHDVESGRRSLLPLPVANVSRDGTKALCVNMARIFDFRPGYGYVNTPDPNAQAPAPEDDGVWVMDLGTGETRLVVSLGQAVDFLEQAGERVGGRKVVVNHITFNPAANRYLFLLRTFPEPGQRWDTFLVTADTAGGGLRNHPVWGIASHYHWRDDRGMLFYAKGQAGDRLDLMVIDDETGARELVDPEYFVSDGHCSYSPDGRYILYDGYPDASTPDYMRALYLYSLERREGITLGRFRSEQLSSDIVDLRCDLHPRWMPDGRSVTFDSIHEGYRGIYWMDVSQFVG